MFIFTSGSSALLGHPRCGLSIWLSLLAIFNTLLWVYANRLHEKTDKTRKYSKSAIFAWYEKGRPWLLGAQSINTERASLTYCAVVITPGTTFSLPSCFSCNITNGTCSSHERLELQENKMLKKKSKRCHIKGNCCFALIYRICFPYLMPKLTTLWIIRLWFFLVESLEESKRAFIPRTRCFMKTSGLWRSFKQKQCKHES